MATINLQLPDQLRDRYKILCTIQGVSMRDDLKKYINGKVSKAVEKGTIPK